MSTKIKYKDITKYKYELEEDYIIPLKELDGIFVYGDDNPKYSYATDHLAFKAGVLTVKKYYTWDGPSGPTIDTDDFMRGALVHDALYQLIRQGVIRKSFRKKADKILYRICREDGMSWFRAHYVLRGVRWFGGSSA